MRRVSGLKNIIDILGGLFQHIIDFFLRVIILCMLLVLLLIEGCNPINKKRSWEKLLWGLFCFGLLLLLVDFVCQVIGTRFVSSEEQITVHYMKKYESKKGKLKDYKIYAALSDSSLECLGIVGLDNDVYDKLYVGNTYNVVVYGFKYFGFERRIKNILEKKSTFIAPTSKEATWKYSIWHTVKLLLVIVPVGMAVILDGCSRAKPITT
jgi:hypothetical protein